MKKNNQPKAHPMARFIKPPKKREVYEDDYEDFKPESRRRKFNDVENEEHEKTFQEFVVENIDKYKCGKIDMHSAEPLAKLDYKRELEVKTGAIKDFWLANALSGKIQDVIPSEKPRAYRTTSKRKVTIRNGKAVFSMGYIPKAKCVPCVTSELEAPIHGELYAKILDILNCGHMGPLAGSMNYCIIRGDYDKAAVIFNLFKANGLIVHKLKIMAEQLVEADSRVSGIFMFLDESRSEYYFEAFRPKTAVAFKKLYGSEFLDIKLDDERKLLYPPTAFSQVNGSMATHLAANALSLLNPGKKTRLVDLYCGYGLISLYMADKAGSTIGMDIEGPAVRAANMNAEHLYKKSSVRYIAKAVTPDSLGHYLPAERKTEFIILDPPRSGTAPGVIETLVARRPAKVLHIFCGTDTIPKELRIWVSNGYKVSAVKVLDMFPGTPNLETMILLEPNS